MAQGKSFSMGGFTIKWGEHVGPNITTDTFTINGKASNEVLVNIIELSEKQIYRGRTLYTGAQVCSAFENAVGNLWYLTFVSFATDIAGLFSGDVTKVPSLSKIFNMSSSLLSALLRDSCISRSTSSTWSEQIANQECIFGYDCSCKPTSIDPPSATKEGLLNWCEQHIESLILDLDDDNNIEVSLSFKNNPCHCEETEVLLFCSEPFTMIADNDIFDIDPQS